MLAYILVVTTSLVKLQIRQVNLCSCFPYWSLVNLGVG